MEDIILKAENVFFSYDDDNSFSLNNLSLEIKKGKKIAIMGPNGSGKSTFFFCCNGINKPSKGTIYFKGEPIKYNKKSLLELRKKIGIVFQDPDNQLFSASVYQEISFGPLNMGLPKEEVQKEVDQIIQHMEINYFSQKPTHALSGGQKKQVSIADILVMHPELIILDEPASSLDPKHINILNNLINEMTENGITVIISTHDVDYALDWADEIILMKDGRVIHCGLPEEVFSNIELLEQTNLNQPTALRLFNCLCKKGILKQNLRIPRNINELESIIYNL